jgi:hypothetical protein
VSFLRQKFADFWNESAHLNSRNPYAEGVNFLSEEKKGEKESWLQQKSYTKAEKKGADRFAMMFFGFIAVGIAVSILMIYFLA